MVNHLADLVRMHTTADGTVVRAYFRSRSLRRPARRR